MTLPEAPLPLPQFTFLLPRVAGTDGQDEANALAAAILALDDDLAPFDFEAPLRRALIELLWSGDHMQDITDSTPLPRRPDRTVEDFIDRITRTCSEDDDLFDLGEILLSEITLDGLLFSRYLIRDTPLLRYARPILDHFGGDHCLFIHFAMSQGPRHLMQVGSHIFLPDPSPAAAIPYLRHELSTIR